MHEFENSWLFQREKIDNLSKNISIINKINRVLKNYDEIRIIDLGTGTGSNFRYLSKKIKYKNSCNNLLLCFGWILSTIFGSQVFFG